MLVREHDDGIADPDLRVTDPAVGTRVAHQLLRPESLAIEGQRPIRAVDDEVRGDGRISLGDWPHRALLRGLHGRLFRSGLHDTSPFRARKRKATAACIATPVASADSFSSIRFE